MLKKYYIFIVLLSLFLITGKGVFAASENYNYIVKIYTYYEDSDYMITPLSSGSGVIIEDSGIVLTNYHVVSEKDSFDNEVDVALLVCLTTNTDTEPLCSYSADIIAGDEDNDLAILQMKKIEGLEGDSSYFKSIERITENNMTEEDTVTALGYPAIGEDTLTVTTGILSGTLEKYNQNWLKTDAEFSYGSSGGALINSDGELIGITTQAHSDLLGSLGYVIDITEVNAWIDENMTKIATPLYLNLRMKDFIKIKQSVNDSKIFSSSDLGFSITIDGDWEFAYNEESALEVVNESDSEAGLFNIVWTRSPINEENVKIDDYMMAVNFLSTVGMTIYSEEKIDFKGHEGFEDIIDMYGMELHQKTVVVDDYMFTITCYYGEDDYSKTEIDMFLDSIVFSDSLKSVNYINTYKNESPFFQITANENWLGMEDNSKSSPVSFSSLENQNIGFSIDISEISEAVQAMSNEDYLKYIKSKYDSSLFVSLLEDDFDVEYYDKSTSYYVNAELYNEVMFTEKFAAKDSDGFDVYDLYYEFRSGDMAIEIDYSAFYEADEGNDTRFKEDRKIFEKEILSQFSLGFDITDEGKIASVNSQENVVTQDTANSSPETVLSLDPIQMRSQFGKNQKGKILLEVENEGRAWYVNPGTDLAYYLGRPADAFQVMREQGIGISNANLEKIPIAVDYSLGEDSDGDGLSNELEEAIGTDPMKSDSDGDGFSDRDEIRNGYDPRFSNGKKIGLDNNFSQSQSGKIFLQVESNGEAWYVDPKNNSRYFLGRPSDAFQVMREQSVGISNSDFQKLN